MPIGRIAGSGRPGSWSRGSLSLAPRRAPPRRSSPSSSYCAKTCATSCFPQFGHSFHEFFRCLAREGFGEDVLPCLGERGDLRIALEDLAPPDAILESHLASVHAGDGERACEPFVIAGVLRNDLDDHFRPFGELDQMHELLA